MFKSLITAVAVLLVGTASAARGPIVKGVFVNASTGEYLNGPVYVATNGNDSEDGASLATAKKTIQAGIAAAIAKGAGTTVLVGPGTYSDSTTSSDGKSTPTVVNMISVKLYLKSLEGKDKTIILGQFGSNANGTGTGARRCIYSGVAGNVVDGFTLRNGATVENTALNKPYDCGGGITGNGSQADANVWIINSRIDNCRAGHGGAFGLGVAAINCHVTSCSSAQDNARVCYRSYNMYNCIFEGNGNGSGAVLSHASPSTALNCTFIGNLCDSSYGVSGEQHYIYNCVMISNKTEYASDSAKCIVSNCVTTSSSSLYSKTAANCVGSVNKYQYVAPMDGDFHVVANSAVIGVASKEILKRLGESWVPSDYIAQDYYGNARPYGENDTVDAGAVQHSADAPEMSDRYVLTEDLKTKITVLGVTHQTDVVTHGTSWTPIFEDALTNQFRVTCDIPEGEAIYAYKFSGYAATNSPSAKFSVNRYPERGSLSPKDEGIYINPPNVDIKVISMGVTTTSNIKWADPEYGDYTGADGSEEKPYQTIQQAVNAVAAGGVVFAKPGTYDVGSTIAKINESNDGQDTNSTPNRVYINKNLRLVSTGGKEVTFIKGAHDTSASGAYSGCGSNAVRCVLVNQSRYVGIQGFTFVDGATDGDLAHRGRWDVNSKTGEPRFNSSDSNQRGNFGGGGVRATNYSGYENCVVTDSTFTNCVAYWGGAMYGGIAQRCLFVGNKSVTDDPGAKNAPQGIIGQAKVLGSIVWNNSSYGSYAIGINSQFRFSTQYGQGYDGDNYLSHLGGSSDPTAASACVNPAKGDFRVHSGSAAMKKYSPVNESCYVQYSTSDFYGRPWLFYDKNNIVAGAVQDVALVLDTTSENGGSSSATAMALSPGESVTVTATGTRKLNGFNVNGSIVAPTEGNTYTYTAPALDLKWLSTQWQYIVRPSYVANQDWYVDANNGSDDNDGWTLATAKKTLSGVMAADINYGETVYAARGDYNAGVMTNTTRYIASSGRDCIGSRVVLKNGVTLKSLSTWADTCIVGNYYSAESARIHGIYCGENNVIDGFTIKDFRTPLPAAGGFNEDNCGGAIVSLPANDLRTVKVRNCYITHCMARSGTAGCGGIYENCIIDNCAEGSDGMFYYAILKNCRIDGSQGDNNQSIFRNYYGIYGCTIYSSRQVGDPDFGPASSSATIENSIIWYATSDKTPTIYRAKNCVFYPNGKFKIDNASCVNIITNTVQSSVFNSSYRLVEGSPAIDAGDMSFFTSHYQLDTDLAGGQRIYNGNIDIGCYEYDWRTQYAKDLKHTKLTVTNASEFVVEADSGVKLTNGCVVAISWPSENGNPYLANFTLAGSGKLTVTEYGGENVKSTDYTEAGDLSYEVESPNENTGLTFTYTSTTADDAGSYAMLTPFCGNSGFMIIVR